MKEMELREEKNTAEKRLAQADEEYNGEDEDVGGSIGIEDQIDEMNLLSPPPVQSQMLLLILLLLRLLLLLNLLL